MSLIHWLDSYLPYEEKPENMPWDQLEQGLTRLRLKLERVSLESFDEFHRNILMEISDEFANVCDDLDDFLDSGDFRFLRLSYRRAINLGLLSDQARRELNEASHQESLVA